MRFAKLLGAGLMALSVTACSSQVGLLEDNNVSKATPEAEAMRGPLAEMNFSADYDAVYRSAIDTAMYLGWQLTLSDRGRGVITGLTTATVFRASEVVTVNITDEFSGGGVRVSLSTESGETHPDLEKFYDGVSRRLNAS